MKISKKIKDMIWIFTAHGETRLLSRLLSQITAWRFLEKKMREQTKKHLFKKRRQQ